MTEYQLLILKICKFENKRVMNENNLKKIIILLSQKRLNHIIIYKAHCITTYQVCCNGEYR